MRAAALLLVVLAVDAHAGEGVLSRYEDDGPFVDWPAGALAIAVGAPMMLVAGAVCAPVEAFSTTGDYWTRTRDCAVSSDAIVMLFTYVAAGAPFAAIKEGLWDPAADALDDRGARTPRESEPAAPPPPPPLPPAHPNVDLRV